MVNVRDSKFYVLLSASLLGVTLLALVIGTGPLIAAQLGLSTATSATIVSFLDAFSTVSYVVTIIGLFSGVGTITSAFAATVLTILKKKGKAKAAAF
jgi:circularin A/uberolysin family circular bacteriocin